MPRRGKRRTNKIQRQIANIHHDIRGIKFKPSADPPPFVVNPWNNLTTAWVFPISSDLPIQISVKNVLDTVCNQLSIPATTSVEVRIRSVSAWLLGNKYKQMFYSIRSPEGNILYSGVDESTAANAPKFGYHLPATYADMTVSRTNDAGVICVLQAKRPCDDVTTQKAYFDTRFRLIWRLNADNPLSVHMPIVSIADTKMQGSIEIIPS
jgi:hypothetical protein